MHFTRLRLAGFKSFVDPTDLVIEPGLTGVVGPNGCGKSNLVEALRWVMGESSARQMRGAEMDDVIFGGTTDRPARNLAEVGLMIDPAGAPPAQFPDATDLEIVRRIERGSGSNYRINGREVRAKDVQLLFADAATGSHSPSLVGQGRISALINARPGDRRAILEDAAGIAGLHSRRHEAELRLRAAETNLTRLDDVLQTLDQQVQVLRRQARQTARYRTLSDSIRQAEAVVLALAWSDAVADRSRAGALLREAEAAVEETVRGAASAARVQAERAAALPPLRDRLAAASAELQRLTLARGELDAEVRRVAEQAAAVQAGLAEIDRDRARELALAEDAAGALERLAEERAELTEAVAGEAADRTAAAAALAEAEAAAAAIEQALQAVTEAIATADARRAALDRRRLELDQRRQRLARETAALAEQRTRLAADPALTMDLDRLAEAVATADVQVGEARTAIEIAARARVVAQEAERAAARAADAAEAEVARRAAEANGLAAALASGTPAGVQPVLDRMTVAPGFEQAVAAALGDDLAVPLAADGDAPVRWEALPPLADAPALPPGVTPLADHVQAPDALARRLGQVGVAAGAAAARDLQAGLAVGQRLVTTSGDLVRWDGYVRAAGAPSAAALRLEQRNRLETLRAELAVAEDARDEQRGARDAARAGLRQAETAEAAARTAERGSMATLAAARDAVAKATAARTAAAGRMAGLDDALARLGADAEETAEALLEVEAQRGELPDLARQHTEAQALRAQAAEARTAVVAARADRDRLERDAAQRARRLDQIARDAATWQERATGAGTRVAELDARHAERTARAAALADRPAELERQGLALDESLERAESARRSAASAVTEAESDLAGADRTARAAEAAAGAAREARVRAEAAAEHAAGHATAVAARIADRLGAAPEAAAEIAGLDPEALPEAGPAEARLERLMRERDGMGPVNLMAESELAELEARVGAMVAEREDLTQAIARLRSAITRLSREGRERLMAAFEVVRAHFEELFVRLFGGGRARLELTDTEDPLGAGLEIMASPPGKRLQLLTLLSGGEQALTALSLIFAVFLTNPSPVCVLDEVDAPLDDANVDRFCTLLGEIARTTGTRFLVITHHRMTMARMDRLFGVTMVERGVSQLVSVDLGRAERLRATG